MSVILVDSYSEGNKNSNLGLYTGFQIKNSHSFTGKSAYLTQVQFYINKYGTPVGNITAVLYAHSGNFGISSVPTGAALATSDAIDITTLDTTFDLISFNFDGTYELLADTKYCIVIEYAGTSRLYIGVDENGEHAGNLSMYYDSEPWYPISTYDTIFYVYGEEITPYNEPSDTVKSIATPISLKVTKEINGFWGANMTILPDDYISTESYIDIKDDEAEEYVVKDLKKIKSGGRHYYDVTLYHNAIEELSALSIDRMSLLKPPIYLLTLILAGSGWTAGVCDIDEIIYLITDRRTSRLEALNMLATKCNGELYYHSKTRIVDLKRQIGTDTKLQLRYDKNCTEIIKEEDSTDLITRIYPYDGDGNTLNTTLIDECEDETLYTASGAGTTAYSTKKVYKSQGIQLNSSTLDETFIRDLGAGNVKDLTGHNTLKFWIYSELANALGFTFGIGESAYTENTVNTGALEAGCAKEVTLDLSGVADSAKNAIRYIGFKNLTGSAVEVVFDYIRAYSGEIYIDSQYKSLYKVNKEYVYNNSAKPEKVQFELILNPSMDTYTVQSSGGSPNGNYGNEGNLYIRNYAGYSYQTFLKYSLSLIPIGATIIGATLGFNVSDIKNGGATIGVYLSAADWNEYTLTWNNMPAVSGAAITTLDGTALGLMECNLLTTVQSWFAGSDNFGLILKMDTAANKVTRMDSRESSNIKPYLKITYTLPTDTSPVLLAGAMKKLSDNEISKLLYKVKACDLSKVIEDTWQDEILNLGDTARVYDKDLGLNVDVRIKKIVKNLLDPADVDLELANKTYNITDMQAKLTKQLSYAMPFEDNPNIINANAVQAGYIGSGVNV